MSSRIPVKDLLVSIQARGFDGDPVAGHLATGLLVDVDAVLVPDPPRALLGRLRACEVLLIPTPLSAQNRLERLAPRRIEVFRMSDDGRPVAVLMTTTEPSRYPAVFPRLCGEDLSATLARHDGDLWASLESIGAVAARARRGPGADLLRRIPAIEAEQRTPVVGQRTLPPLALLDLAGTRDPSGGSEHSDGLCDIFPTCIQEEFDDSSYVTPLAG